MALWSGSCRCLGIFLFEFGLLLVLLLWGKAPKKHKSSKKEGQEDEEEEPEAEEDDIDLGSWCSVDSSDEEERRMAVSSKGCAKVKAKTKSLTKEEKEEIKKWNNPILGQSRKVIKLLEPVVKEAKKANRSAYGSASLKDETTAASTLLKQANNNVKKAADALKMGKKLTELTMELDGVKELCKNIKAKCVSINQVDLVLNGMDDQSLGKLHEVVARRSKAEDVSW